MLFKRYQPALEMLVWVQRQQKLLYPTWPGRQGAAGAGLGAKRWMAAACPQCSSRLIEERTVAQASPRRNTATTRGFIDEGRNV